MTLDIRVASIEDLPAILDLYAQPDIDAGQVLGQADAERIFADFQRYPSYQLYIACDGSDVVGSFALLLMDNLGHLGQPSAVIEDVVVAPDKHRQGIGRLMMKRAMEVSRKAGCYKMTLSTNLKRAKAHKFYEELGFEKHGYSYRIIIDT